VPGKELPEFTVWSIKICASRVPGKVFRFAIKLNATRPILLVCSVYRCWRLQLTGEHDAPAPTTRIMARASRILLEMRALPKCENHPWAFKISEPGHTATQFESKLLCIEARTLLNIVRDQADVGHPGMLLGCLITG